MTRIVNRRCTAAPAVDADAEAERLRRRRAIREAAAKRDLELAPAKMAEADIKASEQRCDQHADEHARLCQPWQDELAALEKAAISRIGRREPPNAEEDDRRSELAKLLASATTDLETSIAAERELQGVARQKARRTREGSPPADTILAALGRPPLANPQLLAQMHICQQRIKWAEARRQAAAIGLKIAVDNIDGIRRNVIYGDLSVHQHKKMCWQAEVAAAETEQAEATAESARIHAATIDE